MDMQRLVKSAVQLLSGGMDSATLAYWLVREGYVVRFISVDYGQRHSKELKAARRIAEALDVPHHIIDLTSLAPLLGGSALTDRTVEVPVGHYSDDTMAKTVVPNRNAMMLSIAWAVAVAHGDSHVAYAAHAGDVAQYPDCRPEFASDLEWALRTGTETEIELLAPFLNIRKSDIVSIGHSLNVPFELTWSCYQGGETHCGLCGTCVERREAFAHAHVDDPTAYAATAEETERIGGVSLRSIW